MIGPTNFQPRFFRSFDRASDFIALLLIGTVTFALYRPEPLPEVAGARLNPFLYTLDLLIPIADFGQRQLWNPNPVQHLIGSAIVVFGWALASIAVIGMTRALKKP